MTKRKADPWLVAPFSYRLLWGNGLNVPPPLFQSRLINIIYYGFQFGTFAALTTFSLFLIIGCVLPQQYKPLYSALCGAFGFTFIFAGIYVANHCIKERERLELPTWGEYVPPSEIEHSDQQKT